MNATHRIVLVSSKIPAECPAVQAAGREQNSDLALAREVLGEEAVRRALAIDPGAWAVVISRKDAIAQQLNDDPAVIVYGDAP